MYKRCGCRRLNQQRPFAFFTLNLLVVSHVGIVTSPPLSQSYSPLLLEPQMFFSAPIVALAGAALASALDNPAYTLTLYSGNRFTGKSEAFGDSVSGGFSDTHCMHCKDHKKVGGQLHSFDFKTKNAGGHTMEVRFYAQPGCKQEITPVLRSEQNYNFDYVPWEFTHARSHEVCEIV
ncbi:hypothetical protein BV22DRAFT_1194511 [Leucogyrophana mollusca]|uniref:Uncharacterized protein n=1 Tax=Leucogyrophana mollusca TaxID=85980 RepID=A0ACB8BM54_9AGAM|nr:hypothetical protein BV22DRAFT_1194511 [Leucogyrophana mollusca]